MENCRLTLVPPPSTCFISQPIKLFHVGSTVQCPPVSRCCPQLGPNPCFLGGEKLGRGRSGKLAHGATLYLVNQEHPFTLRFAPSHNGAGPRMAQRALKSTDKTKGARSCQQSSPPPKRSLKDFFSASPSKVNTCCALELFLLLLSFS